MVIGDDDMDVENEICWGFAEELDVSCCTVNINIHAQWFATLSIVIGYKMTKDGSDIITNITDHRKIGNQNKHIAEKKYG